MSDRFVAARAVALADHLRASGIDPAARTARPASQWLGGCSDPRCCDQHPGHHNGQPMLSVVSRLSGRALHRAAVAAGIIPDKAR